MTFLQYGLSAALLTMASALILPAEDVAESKPPDPVQSPALPYTVNPPADLSPAEQTPWFDHFAWQSFVALNWPVKRTSGGRMIRGVPDKKATVGELGRPRVWESWRTVFDLFREDGAKPPAWNAPEALRPPGSEKVKGYFANLTDTVNQAMAGPLIDQNGHYIRSEIHVNRVFYDFVRNNGYYLRSNLPALGSGATALRLPMGRSGDHEKAYGVIELKASWARMAPTMDPTAYYTTEAWIEKVGTTQGDGMKARVGLIGFHIAVKTAPFKGWVWATFEHKDNTPDLETSGKGKWLLNDGSGKNKSPTGFYPPNAWLPHPRGTPLPKPGSKTQVYRVNKISASTRKTNRAYQTLLKGTVWENYKLIATQWPTENERPIDPDGSYPESAGSPFPENDVANSAIETFYQTDLAELPGLGNSCMSCHYQAALYDFSWALANRAFPAHAADRREILAHTNNPEEKENE